MATNDFIPVAPGPGANVLTQTAYTASSAASTGYQSGVAPSAGVNKSLRQGTTMAAVLAQFIVDTTSQNAVDDGTTATLVTNLKTALKGRLLTTTLFTSNGTWTPNALTKLIRARMSGGGGAGGSAQVNGAGTSSTGGGGAAGAFLEAIFSSGITSPLAITIGAAGVAASGGTGGSGGATSLGTIATAPGGPGGAVTQTATSTAFILAGGGGTGSVATVVGAVWAILNNGQSGGVGTIYSGSPVGGFGGCNPFGTGPQNNNGTNGSAGTGYGSGGSGGSNGPNGVVVKTGGNGTAGFVEIEEYA